MHQYHEKIDKRMFDFPAFYNDMAEMLPDECVVAEVGVAEGASAIFLAEALLNRHKKFTFYLIDNLDYGRDYQLRNLLTNLGKAGIGHLVEIIPLTSVEAACRFPDNHFDFVFIDASHRFEWTKADIVLWWQKVKEGRVLAGHDYNKNEGAEVKEAVDLVFPKRIRGQEPYTWPVEIVATEKGLNVWKIIKNPGHKPHLY